MTAIDVQGTSVPDTALALSAENSAISLKLFRTLKQRYQSLPHLSHYFLVVPDLPHVIYIGADIMVRLNACIDTINDTLYGLPCNTN